jgi:lipid II:glycine glycyltransferase (peptidoglycan interpeptide bridge formation enzyme)
MVKSSADIQPPVTVIIDLLQETETILASMKSKTRYNIRLSARKGVTVRRYGVEMLDTWYSLYLETGKRDKIALHSYDYYRKVFEYGSKEGSGAEIRLYMAESEGKQIAGIVTCFYRGTATYLYGASSNEEREKMPAYALQWKAICDAKEYGCTEYDMFGIPPSDDPSHPMHGLYRFKTGFGGAITVKAGCFDFPLKKGSYLFFRLAEKARNYYYKKLKKRR